MMIPLASLTIFMVVQLVSSNFITNPFQSAPPAAYDGHVQWYPASSSEPIPPEYKQEQQRLWDIMTGIVESLRALLQFEKDQLSDLVSASGTGLANAEKAVTDNLKALLQFKKGKLSSLLSATKTSKFRPSFIVFFHSIYRRLFEQKFFPDSRRIGIRCWTFSPASSTALFPIL